ncbi:hypothetical protein [Ruegeria jejuensis]|uniref:hypothetical protein n=1 Tax=Ruegeria jejuensis TaxID=3233338 RepID=UPI00355B06B7
MTSVAKTLLATLAALAVLSACTKEGTYPISGEECGPDDPVKTLEGADCYVPPAGI